MEFNPENLVIVGAGFSWNAGLPLASNFTNELVQLRRLKPGGPSAKQIRFIRKFVAEIFGEGKSRSTDDWPELEDIFTLIDLSANTGHHLGANYSASKLRVVRRSIIVRMIRMLSQAYQLRQKKPDGHWHKLTQLFECFDTQTTAVLSMNWDTVFERGMEQAQSIEQIDYGCNASPVNLRRGKFIPCQIKSKTLYILKPHGSVNWLYCDACRETFWVRPDRTERVAETLFQQRDWYAVLGDGAKSVPKILSPICPHCKAESLGTRFATFSYRKALDFPMHSASWRTAEHYLKQTSNWVFIGYSMPAADFEFKHLLKRVQLTEQLRPDITVITGGNDADATIERFTKFFGDVADERFFFKNGIDSKALSHLKKIHVLK